MIDRLWVEHSRIWHIDGMEGIPYVKPWKTVLVKRGAATVLYFAARKNNKYSVVAHLTVDFNMVVSITLNLTDG